MEQIIKQQELQLGIEANEIIVNNCANNAIVNSLGYSGGVIGNIGASEVKISNCNNYGTITGSSAAVGGVIGYAQQTNVIVENAQMLEQYQVQQEFQQGELQEIYLILKILKQLLGNVQIVEM